MYFHRVCLLSSQQDKNEEKKTTTNKPNQLIMYTCGINENDEHLRQTQKTKPVQSKQRTRV